MISSIEVQDPVWVFLFLIAASLLVESVRAFSTSFPATCHQAWT